MKRLILTMASLMMLVSIAFAQVETPMLPKQHGLTDNQPAWGISQIYALAAGWNWFSTFIEKNPVDLLDMLKTSLGDNGLTIESADYSTMYFGDGEWVGDLDEEGLVNEQMYLISVNANCTVELKGPAAKPMNHEITIYPGWNWIGFPCAEEVEVAVAFGGSFEPEEEDVIESNADNSAIFLDGEWLDDYTLVPGQGYLYYSNSTEIKALVIQTGEAKTKVE